MKDKINLKKLLKLAGHLVVIAALAFVVKKIIDMDIKLSDLSSPRVVGAFGMSLVIQTAQIIIGCWSWLLFTRSLSGQKIPYSAAMPVFLPSEVRIRSCGRISHLAKQDFRIFDSNLP